MRSVLLGILSLWLVASAAVLAADFWTAKPYLEWSEKEAEKMLTGSPWAATIGVALPPPPPRPEQDAGGGRGGGRGGGGDSLGPGPMRIRVTVSWRSALPVKQAVVRRALGEGETLSADQTTFLEQEEKFYVLALSGLPPQYAIVGPNSMVEATLKRKGKDDIPLADRTSQRGASGPLLLLAFPRGEIVPEDGEVELTLKVDRLSLKRKFKLADMMFQGQLAL